MVADKKIGTGVALGLAAGAGALAYFALKARAATPEPEPGLANLYGMITDVSNGNPIPQVLVSLNDFTTYTDQEGYYDIIDIDPGSYALEFSKAGYETVIF